MIERIIEKIKEENRIYENNILNYICCLDVKDLSYEQKEEIKEILERHGIEVRICDECGKFMSEGYVIDQGSEYYCDDKCMLKNYTQEEMHEILEDACEDGDSYWTEFN